MPDEPDIVGWDDELCALQAVFPPEVLQVDLVPASDGSRTLTAMLQPQPGDDDVDDQSGGFVRATLTLRVPRMYPDDLPVIALRDTKGLLARDEIQRDLLELLAAEAQSLRGSPGMLGHLIDTAANFLTSHNQPDGSCAFCLDVLGSDAQPLVKLPCFHAFHEACYTAWWLWQQRDYARQERELEAHTGTQAARALIEERLPPREHAPWEAVYSSTCPSCRAPTPMAGMPRLAPDLAAALSAGPAVAPGPASASGAAGALTEGVVPRIVDLGHLTALQRRHRSLFARQQAAGGIIDAEAPSAMSITAVALPPAAGGADHAADNQEPLPVPPQQRPRSREAAVHGRRGRSPGAGEMPSGSKSQQEPSARPRGRRGRKTDKRPAAVSLD